MRTFQPEQPKGRKDISGENMWGSPWGSGGLKGERRVHSYLWKGDTRIEVGCWGEKG